MRAATPRSLWGRGDQVERVALQVVQPHEAVGRTLYSVPGRGKRLLQVAQAESATQHKPASWRLFSRQTTEEEHNENGKSHGINRLYRGRLDDRLCVGRGP
jgi:hypothetical protein